MEAKLMYQMEELRDIDNKLNTIKQIKKNSKVTNSNVGGLSVEKE